MGDDNQPSHPLLSPSPASAQSFSLMQLFAAPLASASTGSSVNGISQARILEWVAIFYFRRSSQTRDGAHISYVSFIQHQRYLGSLTQWFSNDYLIFLPPSILVICMECRRHFANLHALKYHKFLRIKLKSLFGLQGSSTLNFSEIYFSFLNFQIVIGHVCKVIRWNS